MPRVTSPSESIDFVVFGDNVRAQRRTRGWSIEVLARRAGIAPQTLLRIEHGYPSTRKKRVLVATALDTVPSRLETEPEFVREDIAIHLTESDRWLSLLDMRQQVPEDDPERIQTAEERTRLGRLGFVPTFVKVLLCRLPKGKLVAGVLEVHGPLLPSRYLGGEVFAFALRGDCVLSLGGETFPLSEGEGCTIDCTKPFYFAPKHELSEGDLPPQVLYVRLDETVPISQRPPPRGTAVEGRAEPWAEEAP